MSCNWQELKTFDGTRLLINTLMISSVLEDVDGAKLAMQNGDVFYVTTPFTQFCRVGGRE